MIGRRLRRNCVLQGRYEPPPVQSATCNLVYMLTPRVSHSKIKSVGTCKGRKVNEDTFDRSNSCLVSLSKDATAVKNLLGVE